MKVVYVRNAVFAFMAVILLAAGFGCGGGGITNEISDVASSGITQNSATITWTTTAVATSQVEYGTTTDYGTTTTLDTDKTTSHSVTVSGLTAGTTYHFRVRSRDESEAEVVSDDSTFVTQAQSLSFDDPTLGTMPVVFLSGTEYEMGYQYGQQVGHYLEEVKEAEWAYVLERMDRDTALQAMEDLSAVIEEDLTERNFLDIFEGMAAGARDAGYDMTYEDALICGLRGKVVNMVASEQCSCVAVWGSAASGGKTIAGVNFDWASGDNSYEVAIVAYPDNGNAFITHGAAGKFGENFVMNDQGLVIGGNKVNVVRPEDTACGVAGWNLSPYIAMICATTSEAKEVILNTQLGSGGNRLVVDKNGNACAIESTAALATVREPGDFGEDDYLITTNFFLNPEMAVAQGRSATTSSCHRYVTLEQHVDDGYGAIDTDDVIAMIKAAYLPSTLVSKVAVPTDKTVYLCNIAPVANVWGYTTGQYIKIEMGDTVRDTAENMKQCAYAELTSVEGNASVAALPSAGVKLALLRAKYDEGVGYFETGCSETTVNVCCDLFGKASTRFAEVQAGAAYLKGMIA